MGVWVPEPREEALGVGVIVGPKGVAVSYKGENERPGEGEPLLEASTLVALG